MAAAELYAPRSMDGGRPRATSRSRNRTTDSKQAAKGRPQPARRRGLVYRALTTGVALSVLGGFGYYAWGAYNGERGPAPTGEIAMIHASSEPLKYAPENPGGLVVPGGDLDFFETVNGPRLTVRPDEEHVLPPPETPITDPAPEIFDRPAPVPMEQAPDVREAVAEPVAVATAEATAAAAVPAAGAGVNVPPVLSAPMLPLPVVDGQALTPHPAARQDVTAQPAEPGALAGSQTAIDTLVAAVDAGIADSVAQPVVPQAAAAGDATVQLASMRSQELAEQEWARLSRMLPDLLGGRQPIIRASTNNGRTFYRVSVPANDAVDAASLCAEIKNRNLDCIVHD